MIHLTNAKHEFVHTHIPGIGFYSTWGQHGDSSVCTDFKPAPAYRLRLAGPRQHGLALACRGLHGYEALLARVDAWIIAAFNAIGAWAGGVVIERGPGLAWPGRAGLGWVAALITLAGLGLAAWSGLIDRRVRMACPAPAGA